MIEMIVVIVILSVVSAFGLTFFSSLARTYQDAKDNPGEYQEALYIAERITRELRNAVNVTSAVPSTTQLTFNVPVGTPSDPSTTITYSLTGTDLSRNGVLAGSGVSIPSGENFVSLPAGLTGCYTITLRKGSFVYRSTVCPRNVSTVYNGDYYDTF